MFALKNNEGFDVLLKLIHDSNKTDTDTSSVPNDYSKDIEKILSSLKLTMKNWKTDTGMYSMIKYDKQAYGLIQDDYNTIGLLRSVVVDDEGRIVAFSPPKSLFVTKEREDHFNKNNIMSPMEDDDDKIMNTNEWYAEEFVEGTMINLFYSDKGEAWEIATKSTVGGNVTFFSPKNPKENIEVRDKDTFRNMFFETCTKLGFKYENLPKEFMYSFVLQHPKNRIVLPINQATLYIIGVYSVNQDTLEVLQNVKNLLEELKVYDHVNLSVISIPYDDDDEPEEDFEETANEQRQETVQASWPFHQGGLDSMGTPVVQFLEPQQRLAA